MKNDFWYPWYPGLFRQKTLHLTTEQDCLYRRLIDYYMETREPLPDSDAALARICGVGIECITNASSILRAFFQQKDGTLHHEFCNEQLDAQDARSKKRSVIAERAAKKRWKNAAETKEENASSMPNAMLKDATRQDRTRQEEKKKGSREGSRLSIESLPPDWEMFCRSERPDLEPFAIFNSFRDYWIAKPGKDGRKADWLATWRNWVRNQKGNNHGNNHKKQATSTFDKKLNTLDLAAGMLRADAELDAGDPGLPARIQQASPARRISAGPAHPANGDIEAVALPDEAADRNAQGRIPKGGGR